MHCSLRKVERHCVALWRIVVLSAVAKKTSACGTLLGSSYSSSCAHVFEKKLGYFRMQKKSCHAKVKHRDWKTSVQSSCCAAKSISSSSGKNVVMKH